MSIAPQMGWAKSEPKWRDRLLSLRDSLVASARFQRWAASFPVTQPIARRRARALFDLCAGFVYSQILLACVRLKVFDILAEGPQSVASLSLRLSLSREATVRLLDAAVALRLVSKRGVARYGLGELGAALLGNPAIGAMVEHHSLLYADLVDPVGLLRGEHKTTALGHYWPYAGNEHPAALSADQVAPYSALMAASQALIADEVLDAYPLQRHHCLLDVGGGEGAFLRAAAERAPQLRLILFDLPEVAKRAQTRLIAAGLDQRATAIGGDFFRDRLPEGADVVSLVRVIHDHDDTRARALLRAVRSVLPKDGALLLAEPMADTRGAEPMGDAYFGFYLLAMGRGHPRTFERLRDLLTSAGFGSIALRRTRLPLQTRVIVARPAG